jgi:hypothetical protein
VQTKILRLFVPVFTARKGCTNAHANHVLCTEAQLPHSDQRMKLLVCAGYQCNQALHVATKNALGVQLLQNVLNE